MIVSTQLFERFEVCFVRFCCVVLGGDGASLAFRLDEDAVGEAWLCQSWHDAQGCRFPFPAFARRGEMGTQG